MRVLTSMLVPLAASALCLAGATAAYAEEGGGTGDGAVIGDGAESLQVIVGPSGSSLDELAVPEATCTEGAGADVCKTVTRTLRRDLTLSFLYSVIPPRSYLAAKDEPVDKPAFPDWINIGAGFLAKAEISGAGPYSATFRFYDVNQKATISEASQNVTGLNKSQLTGAVHEFVNAIIGARTGRPGVFGTRIAFAKKLAIGVKGIGIVDMDGANKKTLISNGSINMLPKWGFGGVLYTSFKDGQPEIFFGKQKLSRDAGHYRSVAVSPDGARMVASISYGGQSDLYLLQKDGLVVGNLTSTGSDEVSPTFSPDGTKVAFVSSAAGSPQIYMVGVGGGDPVRLTHKGAYNYAPDWGKNGLIVFAAMDEGKSDIFTVTEAGEVKRLTQNQGSNKDPSWSPDGRYVAFVSRRSGGSGVYIMSADGRYQSLISQGGGVSNIAWER
ncbi:MAG: TolB protein [Myxococcota bacterium]|jgi:TolB protein